MLDTATRELVPAKGGVEAAVAAPRQ